MQVVSHLLTTYYTTQLISEYTALENMLIKSISRIYNSKKRYENMSYLGFLFPNHYNQKRKIDRYEKHE